ncbi:MAG: hypothetical protein JST30_12210 [Armatimonadetes bacterium]|nr:hypothetical protein [Armatimonadota bacterium]
MKTVVKTLETATWKRSDGDVSVLRLDLGKRSWIGTGGHDWRMLVAGSLGLQRAAQALCLLLEPRSVVWIRGGPVPPPSLLSARWNIETFTSGTWLVHGLETHVDLKSWRAVRHKLEFSPRRWHVPSVPALESNPDWEGYRRMYEGQTSWRDDGSTVHLPLDRSGLLLLARNCRDAAGDRRELIDYELLFPHGDTCIRVLYSSFRKTFRYFWESDADRVARESGVTP